MGLILFVQHRDGRATMIRHGEMVIQNFLTTSLLYTMVLKCPNTAQGIPGGWVRKENATISGVRWILFMKIIISNLRREQRGILKRLIFLSFLMKKLSNIIKLQIMLLLLWLIRLHGGGKSVEMLQNM